MSFGVIGALSQIVPDCPINTDRFVTYPEQFGIYDEWVRFIDQHVCTYRVARTVSREQSFRIDARSRTVNGFGIARFKTVAGKARLIREAPEIATDSRDQYVVYLPTSGDLELSQLRRSHVYRPGSFALLVSSEPLLHTKLSADAGGGERSQFSRGGHRFPQ